MKRYNQICILTIEKIDQREFERFGVYKYLESGFGVIILDLTNLFRSENYQKTYQLSNQFYFDKIIKIINYDQLENFFVETNLLNTFIFVNIPLNTKTKKLYQIISKNKIPYAIARLTAIPDLLPRWLRKISNIKYFIHFHVCEKKILPANVAFISGLNSLDTRCYKINKTTKIINVGSYDYVFHSNMVFNNNFNFPEVVFIDEYFPLHPDFDGKKIIDVNFYYKSVNEFLKKFENKTNLKVGIAVHPRANYKEGNPFDFPLYYGQTCDLIRNSKFIIGHSSTAFSYAVLEFKPIIQISFRKIQFQRSGFNISKTSKELGLEICFLDKYYKIPEPTINFEKYKKYINRYLIQDINIKKIDFRDALVDYLNSENTTNEF